MIVRAIVIISTVFVFVLGVKDTKEIRYLTYTINKGEGFNLRRDVYMRVASLVLDLRRTTAYNWILVLPPWPHLYHWKSNFIQNSIQWSRFFDIKALNQLLPCIEFKSYIKREGHVIDEVLQLQRPKDPWKNGEFIQSIIEDVCSVPLQDVIFGNEKLLVRNKTCLAVQGQVSLLRSYLDRKINTSRSFLIGNFEQLMHNEFGGVEYWKIRRSMIYSRELRKAGKRFMINVIGYDPGDGDGRSFPQDGGGDYLGVHLRRMDFVRSHGDLSPSVAGIVNQLKQTLKEQKLNKVFIATDGISELKDPLEKSLDAEVYWFIPTNEELHRYGDGGVAIIDQWIASHAKYFIGTAESTFSYRIREDRQFMGFSIESTFNQFCGPRYDDNDPHSCPGPSKWLLVEEKSKDKRKHTTEL